ncbi:MAG: hypothetical protein E7Y34_02980, partial [Mycoplasma sp.]|nr:hypothetical protein [Mycoplasma sp.]
GIRVRSNDSSFTLTSTEQSPVFWDKELNDWRYIYDYEALLLQSFPPDFYISNISQAKILRMCGNSVNVEVVKNIIKTMYDIINEYESI